MESRLDACLCSDFDLWCVPAMVDARFIKQFNRHSIGQTNLGLITFRQPKENAMPCTALEFMVVDCKVSSNKDDWSYISVNRHRLGMSRVE